MIKTNFSVGEVWHQEWYDQKTPVLVGVMFHGQTLRRSVGVPWITLILYHAREGRDIWVLVTANQTRIVGFKNPFRRRRWCWFLFGQICIYPQFLFFLVFTCADSAATEVRRNVLTPLLKILARRTGLLRIINKKKQITYLTKNIEDFLSSLNCPLVIEISVGHAIIAEDMLS